jgi:hypothetical protein
MRRPDPGARVMVFDGICDAIQRSYSQAWRYSLDLQVQESTTQRTWAD